MTTRRELQRLACLRLREAEALFGADCYDGCAYLCGYVVELALKAAICATLEWMNTLRVAFVGLLERMTSTI
jgi:HEPN domain-containing protein